VNFVAPLDAAQTLEDNNRTETAAQTKDVIFCIVVFLPVKTLLLFRNVGALARIQFEQKTRTPSLNFFIRHVQSTSVGVIALFQQSYRTISAIVSRTVLPFDASMQ
jgi:hypothetical protein